MKIKNSLPDSALYLFKASLRLADSCNNQDIKLASLYNIGKIFAQYKLEYDTAIFYLAQCEELALSTNKKKTLAYVYNILGIIYRNSNFEESIKYYFKSLEKKRDTLDDGRPVASQKSISNSLNNLGSVYEKMGSYDLALKYLLEGLEIRKQCNYSKGIANSYFNIAKVYQKLKQKDKTLPYLDSAYREAKQAKNEAVLLSATAMYGNFYVEEKAYKLAVAYLTEAMTISNKFRNTLYQAQIYNNLAEAYMGLKDLDKAYNYISQSMLLYKGLGKAGVDNLYYGYDLLTRYYLEKGAYQKAMQAYKKKYDIKDSLYRLEFAESIADMEVRYETRKKENEVARQALELELKDSKLQNQWIIIGGIGALLVLVVVLFIILFNRYKLRQRQKQTELEKKAIETEQRLLRSQMNPHFIFNSLSSVQNYISKDDKQAAMSFLSNFAGLIRNILVNSRASSIPLEDEIATLKLYLDLESLRLKQSFSYQVAVGDNLNPETCYIPPMLVQPFVENAIKHGMQSIKTQGKITLDFKKNESCIYCKICDNGIGRVEAGKHGQTKHKSMALQIIKERLEVLQQIYHTELNFRISDLKDDRGNPIGTEVLLKLPLEEE